MHFTSDTQDIGRRLGESVCSEVETRIYNELIGRATEICRTVARDMAAEILTKINNVQVRQDQYGSSTIVQLNFMQEPPETFQLESKVVSSRESK